MTSRGSRCVVAPNGSLKAPVMELRNAICPTANTPTTMKKICHAWARRKNLPTVFIYLFSLAGLTSYELETGKSFATAESPDSHERPLLRSGLKQQRSKFSQVSAPNHPRMRTRSFDSREPHAFRCQPILKLPIRFDDLIVRAAQIGRA